MKTKIPTVLLSLLTIGCATSHKVPEGNPTARFSLRAEVDASTTTTRVAYTLIHDEKCNNHADGVDGGASRNFGSPLSIQTDPISISSEKPLYFTANYIDSGFAQNRACSLTGVFNPKTDHTYQARLAVLDNVTACQLGIFDISNGQEEAIEFQMPEHVCTGEGGPKIKNGQAMQLNWKIKVIPNAR